MNELLKQEIIKTYNLSSKNKKHFIKTLKDNTGLTNKGLKTGQVKEMIETLIFK